MIATTKDLPHHFFDRSKAELIRQREVLKYASSILSNMVVQDGGGPDLSGSRTASDNTTLTAFAQLCACQTGTARSFISLFDETYQYVVAEATPVLPLVPGIPHDDLLFCGNAFPRCCGICEHALYRPNEILIGSNDGLSEIPVLVIPDLTTDTCFNVLSKPCAIGDPEEPTRFYASVPIQTAKGINIGVICVMHPQPISTWSDAQNRILRNISCSIMSYLEGNRTSANFRSERMNKGISAFMEENFSLAGSRTGSKDAELVDRAPFGDIFDSASDEPRGRHSALSEEPAPSSSSSDVAGTQPTPISEHDNDYDIGAMPPATRLKSPDPTIQSTTFSAFEAQSETSRKSTINLIFSNAAEKIRQATDTEGCLFLDAALGGFGALKSPVAEDPITEAMGSASTSSDEGTDSSSGSGIWLPARILGFSTSESHDVNGYKHITHHAAVAEKLLGTLIRRYPKGKLFTFGPNDGLHPTDSSEEDRLRQLSIPQDNLHPNRGSTKRQKPRVKSWARQNEGRDILCIFPGARSVAFVPVWDPRKNRWYAGGFVYSRQPTRTFTVEGELSYLRVFGILAMTETLRYELVLDEKAKVDALSSMSHELRSPLHGIILGIELLNDTALSVTQGDIVHTLEACGRTLVDTLDHLLDFAKVNNFQTTVRSLARGIRQGKPHSIEVGMLTLNSNVQIDMLAEEVMDSVFAGFNFQHMSIAQLKKLNRDQEPDVTANMYLDSLRAKEELGLGRNSQAVRTAFNDVMVLLDADPACAWIFDTQPGAIRRIVMNLIGNALKYTQHGIIVLFLEQRAPRTAGANRKRQVTITVSDTGCGIGEDFLRYQLFKPFSQEHPLAPGTGLGLSLVKRMTAQLRGRMSVQSRVGLGTSISVTLPLSVPSNVSVDGKSHVDDVFPQQRLELSGLRIRLLGFDDNMTLVNGENYDSHSMIGDMCRNWLGLEVLPKSETHNAVPDIVLASKDALVQRCQDVTLSKLPCVVVCANALVAYQCSTQQNEDVGIVKFISQPIAPRKLATVLLLVFDRWASTQAEWTSSEAESPASVKLQATNESKIDHHGLERPPPSTSPTRPSGLDNSGIQLKSRIQDKPTLRPKLLKAPSINNVAAKFLLVEDNPINLKILSTYMKKLGIKFDTAINGQQAVEAYKRNPSECILTDVSMPVMDGFEATRQIRAHEKTSELASATIIALTGLASSASQNEAFGSGMDLFLTKPVKLKELGAILKSRGLLR